MYGVLVVVVMIGRCYLCVMGKMKKVKYSEIYGIILYNKELFCL